MNSEFVHTRTCTKAKRVAMWHVPILQTILFREVKIIALICRGVGGKEK